MGKSREKFPLWQIFVVLFGAPVLYTLLFVISGVSYEIFSKYAFLAGMIIEYIFFASVFLFLRKKDMSLADVGITLNRWRREVLLGLCLGLLLFVLSGMLITVLEEFLPSYISRETRPLWASLLFGFALVTAFAPIEEIIWRGFAITFLRQHFSTWVAVVIASITFGLIHWWGGLALIVHASIVGAFFSVLFLWRKNLVANILCHLVSDFPMFLFMIFAF